MERKKHRKASEVESNKPRNKWAVLFIGFVLFSVIVLYIEIRFRGVKGELFQLYEYNKLFRNLESEVKKVLDASTDKNDRALGQFKVHGKKLLDESYEKVLDFLKKFEEHEHSRNKVAEKCLVEINEIKKRNQDNEFV